MTNPVMIKKRCPFCHSGFIFPQRAGSSLQCPACSKILVVNDKNLTCLFSLLMVFIFPLIMFSLLGSGYAVLLLLPGEFLFAVMYWRGVKYELKK